MRQKPASMIGAALLLVSLQLSELLG